ncbi:MAG: A/G-specific adenine glycosylase [Tannerella sp.]|jgi:A/G-specific adenine glycosylase|nr:A/G-specific adenine glycosylase [Tannerella sp.]
MNQINKKFEESEIFFTWYEKKNRDLPWRKTKDPYLIWISEVILQQTRVVQGMEYYLKFVRRFPNVQSLAEAPQETVLKYWQGLGYYSRARNLHEAAKDIQSRFHGEFPRRYEDILSLKGVGEYTAAAIASFAWNQPYPVLDGNVFRVLGRLYAIRTPVDTGAGKKQYAELAHLLMNPEKAGLHNQAIMEFGALQCVPQHPNCGQCPFIDKCMGYATGNPQQFPVKQHKTKTRNRYFHYFYIIYKGYTYLHRRTGNDIWEGLFELPLIETEQAMDFAGLQETDAFKQLFDETGELSLSLVKNGIRHVLSHQVLHTTFYRAEIRKENAGLKKFLKTEKNALERYPVPQLIHKYLPEISKNIVSPDLFF